MTVSLLGASTAALGCGFESSQKVSKSVEASPCHSQASEPASDSQSHSSECAFCITDACEQSLITQDIQSIASEGKVLPTQVTSRTTYNYLATAPEKPYLSYDTRPILVSWQAYFSVFRN